MKIYQTKTNKLSGSSYSEVRKQAMFVFRQIEMKIKRAVKNILCLVLARNNKTKNPPPMMWRFAFVSYAPGRGFNDLILANFNLLSIANFPISTIKRLF